MRRTRRCLAEDPRETTKTKDITASAGVVELFEARKLGRRRHRGNHGAVKYGRSNQGPTQIYVVGDDGEQREYSLPRVCYQVQEGTGQGREPLMDGPRNPHDFWTAREKELRSTWSTRSRKSTLQASYQ